MKKRNAFGWRMNANADGFEQPHGRFIMEVFWNDDKRVWSWAVWAGASVKGRNEQTIIMSGRAPSLEDAKKAVLREATELERDALMEDQKFR